MVGAVQIELNPKADQTLIERWADYTGSTAGTLRSLGLIRGISRLFNAIAWTPSPIAEKLGKNAGVAMSGLGVLRLPAVAKDAYTSISSLGNQDGVSLERKMGVAIRDTLEAVGSWANTAAFIAENPALRNITIVADLGYDASEIGLSVTDYNQALVYEEASVGDVKEAYTHTRKYYMMRIAKALISLVSAIFAVLLLFTGLKLLPVIVTISLSLAATITAIRRDLFKEAGRYRLVDLR